MAQDPTWPIQAQMMNPITYRSTSSKLFCCGLQFLLSNAMKIPCMLKPVFNVSHRIAKFHENIGIQFFFSRFQESQRVQARNARQLSMLIIPQASRLTPKLNFSIKMVRKMRSIALAKVITKELEFSRVFHWSTMRLKYRRRMNRQLSHINPSQRSLISLLLVCLNIASGMSSPSLT